MDEEKLIKLLEERFPTKKEFLEVSKNLEDLDGRVLSLKHQQYSFILEMHGFKKDTREALKSIGERLEGIEGKLDELKASANTFDEMLEQYPIERIARLEKHNKLPTFVPSLTEE